jgi:hypothetical protein
MATAMSRIHGRTCQGLFLNLFGEASAGDPDHGPADYVLVVLRETFVVAHAGVVPGDPGQGPLHHPAPGQDPNPLASSRTTARRLRCGTDWDNRAG